jgi:subtilisin family serine protease
MASVSMNGELRKALHTPDTGKRYEVNILMRENGVDEFPMSDKRRQLIDSYRLQAQQKQAGVVAYLREQEKVVDAGGPAAKITHEFWLTNSVSALVSANVLRALAERPDVKRIAPIRHAPIADLIDFTPCTGPNVTSAGIGWGVDRINAPQVWQQGITGTGALVAVIDTGVNYDHPDLRNRMWQSGDPGLPLHGFNFERDKPDPRDHDGHGTACAGIVAGDGTRGTKTGVAPGATIMALKIGDSEDQMMQAVEFAALHDADVISMSVTWKVDPDNERWRLQCERLLELGICHANSGAHSLVPLPNNIGAPGNCPPPWLNPAMPLRKGKSSAVTCGATNCHDELSPFSGKGPVAWSTVPFNDYPFNGDGNPGLMKPDICAPADTPSCNLTFGVTPSPSDYASLRGTSAATPHLAGCMALLVQATKQRGLDPDPARILEALERTADPVVGQTKKKENNFGAGRVNVFEAHKFGKDQGWWN